LINSGTFFKRPAIATRAGRALLKRLLRTHKPRAANAEHRLSLALQGGGAHGAFTWGVLDALLQDPRIQFEGISGSSAGAMNAVVLAHGWMQGGREGARQALTDFWTGLGQQMPWTLVTQGEGDAISLLPAARMFASWAGQFAPTQLNPLALNPLRTLLKKQIDFEALRAHSPFKLFVGATQVNTGKLRVFRENELTVDMLLASACLPKIHHAVEIEGQLYWDGGFSANPAVFPLFYDCEACDVLLVLLSPLLHKGTPKSMEEIQTRTEELGFKAHFMREMQMFARTTAFSNTSAMGAGPLERRLREMRFHMVDTSTTDSLRRADTKMLAHGPFLEALNRQGQVCGAQWLEQSASAVGRHSSIDVASMFA
jgi:NTE family protein